MFPPSAYYPNMKNRIGLEIQRCSAALARGRQWDTPVEGWLETKCDRSLTLPGDKK